MQLKAYRLIQPPSAPARCDGASAKRRAQQRTREKLAPKSTKKKRSSGIGSNNHRRKEPTQTSGNTDELHRSP